MLAFCFIRLKVGIAMYLLYQILVPFVNIQIGSLSFGANLINLTVLIGLFYTYRDRITRFTYKSLIPFFFLYGAQFILIPFQTGMPIGEQLNYFRLDVMGNLLLPFSMINVMKFDNSAYKLFGKVLIIGILVAVFYGLFLTLMPGINPWLIFVLPLVEKEFNAGYALAEEQGRLFGRISSVFIHPMKFGLFLSLAFVYVYSLIKPKKNNVQYFLILGLILVSIFVCGIRTPIGALAVTILFYLLITRKIKLFTYTAITSIVVYAIVMQIPAMADFIGSIFDSKSEDVAGSSLDMRIEQLKGCLKEISGHELTGLGYSWTTYYMSIHTVHPVILAFESLLYVVLCNSGYFGILIWIIMIVLYYRYVSKRFDWSGASISLALLVAYLSYSFITGEYEYIRYFLIFYVLISAGLEQSFNLNPKILRKIKLVLIARKTRVVRKKIYK